MEVPRFWGKRLTRWFFEILLVNGQYIVLQCDNLLKTRQNQLTHGKSKHISYDFFVISKLEVVLDNLILVLLDFILFKIALLHLLEVPCDDVLPSGRNDGVLFLSFALIEPEQIQYKIIKRIWKIYLAGVKETL